MTKKFICSLLMLMLAVVYVNAQPSLTKLIQAVDNSGSAQKLVSELQKSKYTKLKHEDNYCCQVWAKSCSATYTTRKDGIGLYKFSKPKTASANAISFRSWDNHVDGFSMTVFGSAVVKTKIQEIKTLGFKKMPVDPTDYYDPNYDTDVVDVWVYMRKDNPYVPLMIYEHKGGVYIIRYFMS